MPEAVVAYVEAAIDDLTLQTKPLNEELPWLFDIEGGASSMHQTSGDEQ